MTEEFTQEEYEQWRQSIRQPEQPIQTENAELREWIRVMFELSNMCNWRKEHNRIEEFKEIPNNNNLEQSNMQIQEEIVRVKQQMKMPEQPKKVTHQDIMDFMVEHFRRMDESFRRLEETMNRGFKNMNKTLDSTSEGIIVSPNTEESSKETEIREDQNALLSENKNRKNKENVQTMERKTKKIMKTGRRKILNTKEELEMRKLSLIHI